MLIKYDVGWGQCEHNCNTNLITNPRLEMNNEVNPVNGGGSTSFLRHWVGGWSNAFNTPHHIQYDEDIMWCDRNYAVSDDSEINCLFSFRLGASVPYNEGIFTQVNAIPDINDLYTVSMDVQRLNCLESQGNPFVDLRLARTLQHNIIRQNVPTILLERRVIETETISFCSQFVLEPGNDILQIYIHTDTDITPGDYQSFVNIDNVTLTCTTTALTDLTAGIENGEVTFGAVWVSNEQSITTYFWDFGDGNISSLAQPIHTYQNPGTYEVCLSVINQNQCCSQQICKEITVCPIPTVDIDVENLCPNYNFLISNANRNYYYSWSFPDGSTSNGPDVSKVFPSNGSYTITVTASSSCTFNTSTITVNVNCIPGSTSCNNQTNCITIGENANSVTLLSDLMFGPNPIIPSNLVFFGHEVRNLCFSVQGKLIVDVGTIFFTNTNWFMGPGAEIELLPAIWGSRYFIDSQFQGCEMMWRGIVVKSPPSLTGYGGLSIIRTTIKDASRGVELENFTALNSENSSFIDNSTGIFIGNTLFSKVITTQINGTNFENRNGMLPNYPFQQAWNERMAHGIYASNVVKLDVVANPTSKNRFLNTLFGIRTVEVNLNVQNSIFEDSDFQQHSTGINIFKIPLTNRISQGNEFINLTNSIRVNNTTNVTNLYVEHNIFNNIRNGNALGIKLDRGLLLSVVINENDFDFVSGNMIRFEPLRSISIENNRFYMSGSVGPIFGEGVKNKSKINNNIFEANLNSNFPKFCITLFRCSLFEVINNIMYGDVNINGAGGIMSVGNNKCLFRENKVNFKYLRAFYVIGSENADLNGFCCNNAVLSGELNWPGFHFLGENADTRFRQNKLFSMKLAGNFGMQMNSGNEWLGLGSSAELLGNSPINNRFTIDQNISGAMPSSILPVIFSSDWFQGNGIHPTCTTSPTCNIEEFFSHPYDPDFTNTDPDLQDTIIVIVDPARPYCSVVVELFDRLDNVDSIASPIEYWSIVSQLNKWRIWKGESWIESCLNTSVTYDIDIDPWYDVEKEKDKIYHVDEDIRQEMAPIMQVVYDLNDQLDTVTVDSTMILPPHVVIWYDSLKNALDSLQVLNEQIQQDILNKASSLIAQVNALPTPLPFLVDRKKVWQVEMKYIVSGLNAISEGEWSQIRIIANKCPLETGQAVFEAMSLLKLIDEDVEMNTNCPPVIPKSIKKTPLLQPVVYPNPGTGLFVFEIPESKIVDKCIILDMFGRTVWQNQIQAETNSFGADISQHNAGMYLYFFKNGDETIYQGKLIVIE